MQVMNLMRSQIVDCERFGHTRQPANQPARQRATISKICVGFIVIISYATHRFINKLRRAQLLSCCVCPPLLYRRAWLNAIT